MTGKGMAAATLVESIVTESRLPAKVTRQPPVTINTLLTKDEFVRLVTHMANDNPISHFLVAWTDDDGKPRYSRAGLHRRADVHASWTYDTMTGKAKRKTSMGLYPKNNANESTWGALDFDAHEHGQDELAKSRAIRAFTLTLEYRDRYLILSASGRGYPFSFWRMGRVRSPNGHTYSKTLVNPSTHRFRTESTKCFPMTGRQIKKWGAQSAFPARSTRRLAKSG